jgi:hypothetical protein
VTSWSREVVAGVPRTGMTLILTFIRRPDRILAPGPGEVRDLGGHELGFETDLGQAGTSRDAPIAWAKTASALPTELVSWS